MGYTGAAYIKIYKTPQAAARGFYVLAAHTDYEEVLPLLKGTGTHCILTGV